MKYVNVIINKKSLDSHKTLYRCVLVSFEDRIESPEHPLQDILTGTRIVRADKCFTNPAPDQSLIYKIEDDGYTLIEDRLDQHDQLVNVKRPYHIYKEPGPYPKNSDHNFLYDILHGIIDMPTDSKKFKPFEADCDEAAILYVDNVE